MASTRLNNSAGEYCLQQRGYNRALDFELYKFKCIPKESAMPGLGVNMPMMTNGYNNNVLSRNASDVESALLAKPESKATPPQNPMSADRVKWEHIHRVFELCNRNVSETARRLKMHRRTLQRILSKRSPK